MPVLFGIIGYRLPAGVLLYWIVTNIWSILQQLVMAKFGLKVTKVIKAPEMGIQEKVGQDIEITGNDKPTNIKRPRKRGKKRG